MPCVYFPWKTKTTICHFRSYLVFKSLAGMQWAAENLPNHTLYSYGDDDVFVNLTQLHNLVEENWTHFTKLVTFPVICVYGGRVHPVRNPQSKYYISKKLYADDVWLRFCIGGFYTTNVATASLFYARKSSISNQFCLNKNDNFQMNQYIEI